MVRRPAHKTAHSPCPFGQFNWVDCDGASAHQWGRCIAITGDREPTPCTRWSMDSDGYCFQHFVMNTERVKRESRIAIARALLAERITMYIEWTKDHPSVWDSKLATKRKVAAGAGIEPTTKPLRKGPYRMG